MKTRYAFVDVRWPPLPPLWLHDSRKGGDMQEWPPDLRVREFPEAIP